ncbi:MAG: leucine-rich repeat protein [Lachnospiraceae bacterium]|nr:leucine-rich repeat protein [Lachnospiraceae bacterium]
MTRRLVSFLLVFAMTAALFTVLPVSAEAVSGKCGSSVNWEIKEKYVNSFPVYELVISGSGRMYNYNKAGDCPWASYLIGNSYFTPFQKLEKITVKSGVTYIGSYAFANAGFGAELILADSITEIGEGAFMNYPSSVDLKLPSSLRTIGAGAFYKARFNSVTFPGGLTEIGEMAFYNSQISGAVLPDTVTSLGAGAFAYCDRLSSVRLSSGLDYISDHAFFNCNQITKVTIPKGVEDIGVNAFASCHSLTGLSLPSTLSAIESEAFASTALSSVSIPDSVVWVGSGAFSGTPMTNNQKEGVVYAGNAAVGCWPGQEGYIIREGTRIIAESAFLNMTGMKYAIIPDSVITICDGAFKGCTALETVSADAAVIWDSAFEGSGLQEAILKDSLRYIGANAFKNCTSLKTVAVLGTDVEIENNAFSGVSATALYEPAAVFSRKNYGGQLTWKPFVMTSLEVIDAKKDYLRYSDISFYQVVLEGKVDDFSFVVNSASADFDYDTSAVGPGVVTVRFDGLSCDFDINVTEDPVITERFGTSNVIRSSGKSRFETAVATADRLKAVLGLDRFDTVIVASGDNFPDALAGSYLAVKKHAPILMVDKAGKKLDMIADYVRSNLAEGGQVYILGGTGAVSGEAESVLGIITPNVKRLSGKNRYETNLAILDEAGILDGEDLLIANALNFADALSASALGKPILLADKNSGALTAGQTEFLGKHSFSEIYILGGTGAVPQSVADAAAAAKGISPKRLYGSSRYETSTAIAAAFFGENPVMAVATGEKFPDGLSGGPLANALGAPLILASEKGIIPAALYSTAAEAEKYFVFGGSGSLSDDLINVIRGVAK